MIRMAIYMGSAEWEYSMEDIGGHIGIVHFKLEWHGRLEIYQRFFKFMY